MIRTLFAFSLAAGAALASAFAAGPAAKSEDPYLWMEEIEGARALDWARKENARSLPVLEADPRFAPMKAEALAILTSQARIPYGAVRNGEVRNFWQDDKNVRGLWRRAPLAGYVKGAPVWDTLIDFDALAEAEGENWVSEGFACLGPTHRHCMVEISRGGADAALWREFDVATKSFVEGGFFIPVSKSGAAWIDENTLLVGADLGPDSMTTSGYPRTARVWRRGEPLENARIIFEGEKTDVAAWSRVERDGAAAHIFVRQSPSFFESVWWYGKGADAELAALPLPRNADLSGVLDGRAIFTLREAWSHGGKSYPLGSIIAYDLASGAAELVFAAASNQSVQTVAVGKGDVVFSYLEDVSGKAARLTRKKNGTWAAKPIALPANGVVKIVSAGGGVDDVLLSFESMTTPQSLYHVKKNNKAAVAMTTPAFFDASDIVVEQRFATSKDGTRVPYFIMGRKSVLEAGNAPTVQYAYGGFLSATLPVYYENPSRPQHGALAGKMWVSRGGVLVLSNIRGGSEYGPAWHQAALKENRQRAFDDFFAISEALIADGVTSPQKLGAIGRSNGGLLMGVVTNQRPELYRAVVNGVPLFDMKRYTRIGAGASWMGEYGDPDKPAEWAYISKYSPYQNMKAGAGYPKVFFYTSTQDDRVHPAHARKAGARMRDLGYDFFYYENMEGGHSGAANQDQLAYRIALEYAYFAHMLMDE